MYRAVNLLILSVFLIAIVLDCLQPSRVVVDPIMFVDNVSQTLEILAADDESDYDAAKPSMAERVLLSIAPSTFALASQTADLASVQATRDTVLRLSFVRIVC